MAKKKAPNTLAASLVTQQRKRQSASDGPAGERTVASSFHNQEPKLDRRTTIYLSSGTATELKVAAAREGTNVSQIIERLVRDYLESQG